MDQGLIIGEKVRSYALIRSSLFDCKQCFKFCFNSSVESTVLTQQQAIHNKLNGEAEWTLFRNSNRSVRMEASPSECCCEIHFELAQTDRASTNLYARAPWTPVHPGGHLENDRRDRILNDALWRERCSGHRTPMCR